MNNSLLISRYSSLISLAIAALLYKETPPEQLQSLEDIEETVRQQVIERVSPEIGNFFIETKTGTTAGRTRIVKSMALLGF